MITLYLTEEEYQILTDMLDNEWDRLCLLYTSPSPRDTR